MLDWFWSVFWTGAALGGGAVLAGYAVAGIVSLCRWAIGRKD